LFAPEIKSVEAPPVFFDDALDSATFGSANDLAGQAFFE
jgi:hypothetical protein